MSETSKDYLSKYAGEQVEARLDRCNLVPTLDHVPTEEDRSFVDDEGTHTFLVGDECRYYDAEKLQFVFYKLHDITEEGAAVWLLSGSAGGELGGTVTFNVTSNQGVYDTHLNGIRLTVRYDDFETSVVYQGVPVEMPLPAGKRCTVVPPDVRGYKTPEGQQFDTVAGGEHVVNLQYLAESVYITATADDGVGCASQVVTVKVGDDVYLEQAVGSGVSVLIPFDAEYTVRGSEMNGHKVPSATYTASQTGRQVALVYEFIEQALLIFDLGNHSPANITVEEELELAPIYAALRRCLVKPTADGAAICYLSDANTNQYYGGQGASLTGSEGDVGVYLPDIYYKYERLDSTHIRYCIRHEPADDTYVHIPASIIGAYKGYVEDGTLYSRSGVTPTVDMTFDEFKAAAEARGTGFQLIDFAQHCLLAMLLYARYKTRDMQATLGAGTAAYSGSTGHENVTGTSNANGGEDTAPSTDTGYVCGLRVEGIFGCIYEYMEGVTLKDKTWTITDPDGTRRTIETEGAKTGWIRNMALETGDHFDLVPTAIGGSASTEYTDFTEQVISEYIPLVAARSCFTGQSTYDDDGIAYINAVNTSYIPSEFYGTRLAYRGKITVIDDVESFRGLSMT